MRQSATNPTVVWANSRHYEQTLYFQCPEFSAAGTGHPRLRGRDFPHVGVAFRHVQGSSPRVGKIRFCDRAPFARSVRPCACRTDCRVPRTRQACASRADVHAPVRALLDEAERMRRGLVWRDARVSWLCSGEARMAVVVRAAAVLSAAVVSLPVLTALANDEDPRQPRRSLRHFRCRRLRCGLVSVCAVCLLSRLGSMLWWRATPCLFSIPDVRSSRVSLLVAVGPVACGRLQVLTLTSSSALSRVDVGDELEPSRFAAYFR